MPSFNPRVVSHTPPSRHWCTSQQDTLHNNRPPKPSRQSSWQANVAHQQTPNAWATTQLHGPLVHNTNPQNSQHWRHSHAPQVMMASSLWQPQNLKLLPVKWHTHGPPLPPVVVLLPSCSKPNLLQSSSCGVTRPARIWCRMEISKGV